MTNWATNFVENIFTLFTYEYRVLDGQTFKLHHILEIRIRKISRIYITLLIDKRSYLN